MAKQIFIRPSDGKKIRLESGQVLPEEGSEVVLTTYIQRRIICGDATIEDIDELNNQQI
jgi:hypothetical protein